MATTNSKIAAAKKLASKVKAKGKKKDYSPQNPPQSKVYREVNDEQVSAKPVGWRWTTKGATKVGANPDSRPSNADVEKYRGKTFKVKGVSNRYVYQEKRVDKSDKSRKNKFQEGGTLGAGSFKDGGKVGKFKYGIFTISEDGEKLGHTFYSNNPDLEFDPYGDDVPVSVGSNQIVKRLTKFQEGGTLGAGSFKDGGSVKQTTGQYAKKNNTSPSRSSDKVHQAKPVGWRFRGNKYRVPSQRFIDQQLKLSPDERDIYYETRRDKSDKDFDARLEQGGTLGAGSFKKGGATKKYLTYYDIYDDETGNTLSIQAYSFEEAEDIASTIEFDNFRDGEEIEYGTFKKGGTLGAGSFKDGGSLKQTKGQYAKKHGTSPSRSSDKVHQAKPVGWRFRGNKYRVPSQRFIDQQLKLSPDERDIYYETRRDKSDKSFDARLEQGGTLGAGSFARGGRTSYRPQYVRNEDIASITLKSGKVIKNDSIYDGAYVSKSLKLQDGGTLGAGSFQDGGTLGAGSFARGGVERIANTQAREYTENLIPFKGNNLEGKTLDNGDYVVLSYGYYPIWWYCKKQGKWYGNSTKYSVTTSKQMSQSRPTYDATMLSKNDLLDMMMKHNSSFEDGGLLDNILSDTSVDATQNVGGTTFSQGSLTDNMDITNPNF